MSDRSGLSRGDRHRNARLARLRELLPPDHAIVAIDLADGKQAAVVTDHDSRVLARRRVSARASWAGCTPAKSIRCDCRDCADLQERPGHRQASNTGSGNERRCSSAGEPRSDRTVGRGHVGIGRNKYRPRNDVGERRSGGAQHSLDIIDGPHRLGRRVMASDDLASLVRAVLAADVDRRRPRGNYGSMAKGRAPHEAIGLQVSNLHG